MEDFDSRWACPKCGSKDVEIALPMWCRESRSYDLTPCNVDEESAPIYWFCNTYEAVPNFVRWLTDWIEYEE